MKVESSDINAFLRENHVQGDVRGQSACYALMHAGEIIAVASFGKPRYNANYEWEWLRYADTIKKTGISKKTYDFHTDSSNVKTLYFDAVHRAQNNRLRGRRL